MPQKRNGLFQRKKDADPPFKFKERREINGRTVPQDEHGYLSPNRERLEREVQKNDARTFPVREDRPSEAEENQTGWAKNAQNAVYQARLTEAELDLIRQRRAHQNDNLRTLTQGPRKPR